MRAVIQRVLEGKVEVDGNVTGSVKNGFVILLGVHKDDKPEDTKWLVNKIIDLRCFQDENDKMNLSLKDIKGGALIISQFTLYANCARGRRPDFLDTAAPDQAEPIYEKFVQEFKQEISDTQTGVFGAYMHVSLVNDGPVTFVIDSQSKIRR